MLTFKRGLHVRLLSGVFALVAATGLVTGITPATATAATVLPLQDEVQFADLTPATTAPDPGKPAAASPRAPASLRHSPQPNVFSTEWPAELEPNDTPVAANPLTLDANGYVQMQANILTAGDVDYFSFQAQAGDRVYLSTMTSFNTSSSADSQMNLLASDGTTVIEFDDDDGSLATTSSSIANATLATAGTYYVRINHFSATNFLRPYYLHLRLQRGAPTPEVEANDTPATANPLPANGWVSGTRNPAAATEQDWYSFTANAGDTVFLSLDMDPERDNVQWDGRLGIALFGDAANQILVVNDASTGSVANPLSEALFFTIKTTGTYFAFVDSASAAVGGPTATYTLSVSIATPPTPLANCTTYTSTDIPKTIGPTPGLVSSTITIPGNPIIADLDVSIELNHALMQDVDVHLRSPQGNDNGIFSDIGAAAVGGQAQLDVTFDDEAAIAPAFTALRNMRLKPELAYRLQWFDGMNAGGTWTLDIRDDTNNASGGTLTNWSLRVCEAPPPPVCAAGFTPVQVFNTDFESGAAGFTHSGTADEWELGLPATVATTTANPVAAFNNCASGVNCWKTDLDNTYNISSTQDLLSPAINLAGLSPPVVVRWSHRYQMESASFDHYLVDFQQVGGATPVRVFEWSEGTMTDAPGNPVVNIGASAGWGQVSARADSLAGLNTELRFHLDSDNTVNFGGVAVDDVSVTACRALAADLSITKTDGVTTAVPGGSVTYTITASNAGTDPVPAATVADTFPASLTCTWTCVGAGGGTCTASGAGNINDNSVNLPVGGSVTYTASCAISAAATGSLSNTATVSGGAVSDPVPGNNSATDTDTLTPQADLSITKTDGVTSVIAGGSTTYTITSSNAGPSNASGVTAADTFPASLTCNWTCIGAGGGTCTASGSGNINDTVNLPAGGSVTHTAVCTISPSATGNLTNTATVTAPGGVTDPNPANNSATDTDTIVPPAVITGTKTVAGTFSPNGTVTYTVVLSNSGGPQGDNPGNEFTDVLPASLTLVSANASSGTAVASVGTNTVTWNGAIAASGSVTITIVATINASASGTISNQGTISYDSDGNGSNNATALTDDPGTGTANDPTSFGVIATSDLSITKTDGLANVTAGGSTTYTIVASNAGPSAATGATVSDTFPAVLTCTWTCTGSGGGTCTASGSGNIGDTVNLPSGAAVTYTAVCAISASATGTLSNTATVAAPGGVTDPNAGNNSATDTDTIGASADLAITKTDGVASVSAGGSTTYTIVASNAGPSTVVGATVADTFPATLTCTWTCAGSGGGTCTASGSGNISDTVNLPAGGSVAYTAVCAVAGTASGTLSNTATVGAAGVSDPNPANNSATDTDTVDASADLSITKTDGLTTVSAGGTTTYTIVATNPGPATASGATVSDAFPAGLTCTWTCAGTGGASCAASGSGNINDPAQLPGGSSVTYTAVCAVGAGASGTLTNTATIAAPAGLTDPNPGNNSAIDTTDITVVAGSSLRGSKAVSGSFTVGGNVVYTITLSNIGSGNQGDNPGDEFTDLLPAQLQLVSASASSGTAAANTGTNTVTWNGAIAAGGSVTITINATVRAGASGSVSNQGSFVYDGNGDGSNDTSGVTDDPAVGGSADATAFVIAGTVVIQPVPGLTAWGMLLMGLGLFALALRHRDALRAVRRTYSKR